MKTSLKHPEYQYLNLAKEILQKNEMTKMTNEERILE